MDPISIIIIVLIIIGLIILIISIYAFLSFILRNVDYTIFNTYPLFIDAPDDINTKRVGIDPSLYQLYWSQYFDFFLSPILSLNLDNINKMQLVRGDNDLHFQFVKNGDIYYVILPQLKQPLSFSNIYTGWWIQLIPNQNVDPNFKPYIFFLEITNGITTYSLDIEFNSPDNLIFPVEQTRDEPFPLLYMAAKKKNPDINKAVDWFSPKDFGISLPSPTSSSSSPPLSTATSSLIPSSTSSSLPP